MNALPARVAIYRRTPAFDEHTLPEKLRRAHQTKPGVWGRIRVLEGALVYRILEPSPEEVFLGPGDSGIIEPEVPHQVTPRGSVRFFIEFLKEP